MKYSPDQELQNQLNMVTNQHILSGGVPMDTSPPPLPISRKHRLEFVDESNRPAAMSTDGRVIPPSTFRAAAPQAPPKWLSYVGLGGIADSLYEQMNPRKTPGEEGKPPVGALRGTFATVASERGEAG